MKVLKGLVAATVIAVPVMFSSAVMADGATIYKKCAGCHGADAMGGMGGKAPRLAGMGDKYIAEQFKLIRDGKRASGASPMMKGAVASVSDADADTVAKYLAAK